MKNDILLSIILWSVFFLGVIIFLVWICGFLDKEYTTQKYIKKKFPNFFNELDQYFNLVAQADSINHAYHHQQEQVSQAEKELSYTSPCTPFFSMREQKVQKEIKKLSEIYQDAMRIGFQVSNYRKYLEKKYFFVSIPNIYDAELLTKKEIKKVLKSGK
jgi:hypothetical protein